jgi:AcrR family transcriptional regulator
MYVSQVTDIQSGQEHLTRLDRRKARTRAALVQAAQAMMAEGRTNVPILEITEAADLGTGSFYNHFESKEELFGAAVEDALARQGDLLDAFGQDLPDPAAVFAQGFRLTGRLHRLEPQLSKVALTAGMAALTAETGLAPRARRDILAGVEAGRFRVPDIDVAMVSVVGSTLALAQLLHDRPDLDDAVTTDLVAQDVLRVLGMTPRQAEKVCALPLPSLPESLDEILPHRWGR